MFRNVRNRTAQPSINLGLILIFVALPLALTAGRDLNVRIHKSNSKLFSNLSAGRNATTAGSIFQFSAANYSANEGDVKVTLTVNRSGDTSGLATVDYATNAGAPPPSCGTSNGIASEACDYTMTLGTLQFASNETSKTVTILLNDDTYQEGPETFTVTLSNPNSGSGIGSPATTNVTLADNDSANGQSAVKDGVSFNNTFFASQQYVDFLNRQPDPAGLAFWKNQLDECETLPLPPGFTDAQTCREVRRINVSAAFFVSIEFQNTGYLVYRLNQAVFNSGPTLQLRSFLKDTQEIQRGVIVGQGNWQQQLDNNKVAFVNALVARPEFIAAFPASMTAASFVDTLNANTKDPLNPTTGSLTQTERDNLVATLSANPSSTTLRAQTLRSIAENSLFQQREFSRAFVLMQYFGYLRRNPNSLPDTDFAGYNFWLTKLNSFGGNYITSEMVKAFITSGEYIGRFGPGSVIGPGLTPEQRLAALEDVKAKFESLRSNPDRNAVNQALLDFIRGRSEFAAAGISVDSCVWARYTDGVDLIIINNRQPPVGPPVQARHDSSSSSPEPEDIPDSNKARLVFALGGAFFNTAPDIRTWLNAENYTQAINEGPTVDQLLTVGGDGVFYFDGHGGTGHDGEYIVVTATEPTALLDGKYKDDLEPDASGQVRLTYAIIPDHFVGLFAQKKYAIGGNFIRKYWKNKFLPNSFFYNAACDGAGASAADFEAALKEAGVSVYAGWTNEIGNLEGYRTARFVFDRLLGANQVNAESDGFKQRPFDYHAVVDDLKLHSLGKDSGTGAELVFVQLSDGFKMLAPGIWLMDSVDEYLNELVIIGSFGKDPGNRGAVFVGGQQCHINSWTDTTIRCDLPVSGDGSSGEVLVTVGQQKSNAATLTEWEGDFTHTVNGLGTLKQTVVYHVRFRADIRKARTGIHQPPTILPRTFSATENSVLFYQNSGFYTAPSAPNGQSCTETWTGSSSFQRGLRFFDRTFALLGTFNDDRKLTAQLSVSSMSGRLSTTDCTNPTSHNQNNLALLSPKFGNLQDTFTIVLDSSFNIVGDTKTFTDAAGNLHTMKWDNIQAKFPPKSDSPR